MVVANVVELLAVALYQKLLVGNLVLFGSALSLQGIDFALVSAHAAVKAGDGVRKVFNFQRQLAADVSYAVHLGEDGLQFVEGFESLLHGAGSCCFFLCCHCD